MLNLSDDQKDDYDVEDIVEDLKTQFDYIFNDLEIIVEEHSSFMNKLFQLNKIKNEMTKELENVWDQLKEIVYHCDKEKH